MRLHATAVLVGERGVLIRGPSGSGKSSLALALLLRPIRAPGGAGDLSVHLISDDQTLVEAVGGRLLARPHPNLTGRIEARGYGLLWMKPVFPAVIGLVVDRGNPDRLPAINDHRTLIEGVEVPRIRVSPADSDPVQRVLQVLFAPAVEV